MSALWQPSNAVVARSQMTAFTNFVEKKSAEKFTSYDTLHKWSIDYIERFWTLFFEFSKIRSQGRSEKILNNHTMPGARWFSGKTINFTENLLWEDYGGIALKYHIESLGCIGEYTFTELRQLVAQCARGLQNAGIKSGDRVAGYLANVPEAVIACLACASLGAVWSSASPDFGLSALVDRFVEIEPKLIFVSTHYRYSGKTFYTRDVVNRLKRSPAFSR